ncbi:hypothetical protein LIER_30156 [Lithospermum erythrorhizon]|uniref:Uncharacterized protein n=1 Tax=Lithospermum erythrorhizon TaxID=34254 RepID=A0AAV3RM30_LITER
MAGSGILKDAPPYSPNRENSPIHTIDANTLNQEETHDNIFEEIDNYPFNPIASESAAIGLDVPTGSSNQATEAPAEAVVWDSVQSATNPSKVEVEAMKGKRLPRFNSQLLICKPLVPGATPIPIVSSKRSSTLEPSATASKKAKIEALNAVTAASSNHQPLQTVIISLNDELTTAAQEAAGDRKEKSKVPSTVRSCKTILPLLVKARASSKKSKGKIVPA